MWIFSLEIYWHFRMHHYSVGVELFLQGYNYNFDLIHLAWLRVCYHKSVAEASLYLGGVDPG